MKLIDKLFAVSLSLISLTSLVVTVTGFAAIPLPPLAGRILALVNLLSLPVLLYSTVLTLKEKLAAAKALAQKGHGAKPLKASNVRPAAGTEAAPKADAPVKAAPPVKVTPPIKVTPAPRQGSKKKKRKKKK